MDATTFDGISRHLGSVSTRRGFVRLLGGAAAVGTVLAAGTDTLARNKGKSNGKGQDREQVSAQGKGKGKKITICYLNQTKKVKKSKLGNFPGATKGACPPVGDPDGDGKPTPQVCTRWILSGGPNQTDKMSADDDLYIANLSKGGQGILFGDNNKTASVYSPVVFDASVGDKLTIVAHDGGGCRSVSPIWLHCQATGQKRQIYAGYSGSGCSYTSGQFVNQQVEVWI